MSPHDLSQYVKAAARDAGFDLCGVARAEPIKWADYLRAWLDAGRCGSMAYLRRHLETRVDPSLYMSGARSVIAAALSYYQEEPAQNKVDLSARGRVARYAWGDDYHEVVKAKLAAMIERMRADLRVPFDARACVDTAPIVERELAAAAGLGWIGKNTLVLNCELGSYFFIGTVITTLDLEPDEPLRNQCGTCTACLQACPTGALTSPYEMDASRCISYLTIEHRGEIPEELQTAMDDWIFGCDVCQDVCPYNRHAPATREPRFALRSPGHRPRLDEILAWTTDACRNALRGSAMKRATLDMLQRNARIVMKNAGHSSTDACAPE